MAYKFEGYAVIEMTWMEMSSWIAFLLPETELKYCRNISHWDIPS